MKNHYLQSLRFIDKFSNIFIMLKLTCLQRHLIDNIQRKKEQIRKISQHFSEYCISDNDLS